MYPRDPRVPRNLHGRALLVLRALLRPPDAPRLLVDPRGDAPEPRRLVLARRGVHRLPALVAAAAVLAGRAGVGLGHPLGLPREAGRELLGAGVGRGRGGGCWGRGDERAGEHELAVAEARGERGYFADGFAWLAVECVVGTGGLLAPEGLIVVGGWGHTGLERACCGVAAPHYGPEVSCVGGAERFLGLVGVRRYIGYHRDARAAVLVPGRVRRQRLLHIDGRYWAQLWKCNIRGAP